MNTNFQPSFTKRFYINMLGGIFWVVGSFSVMYPFERFHIILLLCFNMTHFGGGGGWNKKKALLHLNSHSYLNSHHAIIFGWIHLISIEKPARWHFDRMHRLLQWHKNVFHSHFRFHFPLKRKLFRIWLFSSRRNSFAMFLVWSWQRYFIFENIQHIFKWLKSQNESIRMIAKMYVFVMTS